MAEEIKIEIPTSEPAPTEAVEPTPTEQAALIVDTARNLAAEMTQAADKSLDVAAIIAAGTSEILTRIDRLIEESGLILARIVEIETRIAALEIEEEEEIEEQAETPAEVVEIPPEPVPAEIKPEKRKSRFI